MSALYEPNSPFLLNPAPFNILVLFLSLNAVAALIDAPEANGRIGNVLTISSTNQVAFFITSETGPAQEVAAIFINCHIKKVIRKNKIRLAKTVCPASLIVLPVVSKGSFPRMLFSLTFIELISHTSNIDDQLWILIVTPLISWGSCVCIIFCILTTKIRIIENHATKITGLKIRLIITLKLRYLPIHHPLFSHPSHLSLKKSIESIISGDAMINIHKNATLMILAKKSSANQIVYATIISTLKRNEIVSVSAQARSPTLI